MDDGTEIERKFLLDALPADLRFARRQLIRQGYLALDGETEVRVRMGSEPATLTIKSGRGEVRTEEALALDARQAQALWELTEGRRLEKLRRRIRVSGAAVEVDEYQGRLAGLVVAEVEFDDEQAARAFRMPDWFVREVTGDPRYANRSLAVDGLADQDG
jgi:adenylate cyclase